MTLPQYFYNIDVHTHDRNPDHEAIVSISPRDSFGDNPWYSVGIHPWEADEATAADWQKLEAMAADTRCVAIGECGLDNKRGPAPEIQEAAFRRQVLLAESTHKPLIIHCVGCVDALLRIRREMRPAMPWILHGFRGKPRQAQQLTAHGLYLSLGTRHNPDVPAAVPASHLLHETD